METKNPKLKNKNCKALHGLYVVTPDPALHSFPDSTLINQVRLALAGGATLVQYRDKSPDNSRRSQLAEALRVLCADEGALFIVNDDVTLARAVQADGVHIGQADSSIHAARLEMDENAIIGVSCYNQLELAQQAQSAGADYVAFGRFFPSATKPAAVQASVETLAQAKKKLHIPICCIGGITAENAKMLVSAGADMLAVIDGVFGQPDIRKAATSIAELF